MNVLRLQVYANRRQKIESKSGFLANLSPLEDTIDYPSIQSHKRRDSQQFRIAKHPAAARLLFSPHGERSRPLLSPGVQAAQSNTRR